MASSTPAHVADTEYLVRKAVNTGYHYCSLLSPPAYVAFTLARRGRAAPFSINRLLRATWIGGLGGTEFFACTRLTLFIESQVALAVVAWPMRGTPIRMKIQSEREEYKLLTMYTFHRFHFGNECSRTCKTNRIRAEDHATIGTVLFAVLIPALLWKRAHIVNRVLFAFPSSVACISC